MEMVRGGEFSGCNIIVDAHEVECTTWDQVYHNFIQITDLDTIAPLEPIYTILFESSSAAFQNLCVPSSLGLLLFHHVPIVSSF
jgi:hypothetical protein